MAERSDVPVVRLVVTLAALAVLTALSALPIPGMPLQTGEEPLHFGIRLWPSLVMFVRAYALVEFTVALVPRWRALRAEITGNRPRLLRAALGLGLVNVAVAGILVPGALEKARSAAQGEFAALGSGVRAMEVASLLGASAMVAGLAMVTSRRGLGQGFAVLLVTAGVFEAAKQPAIAWSGEPVVLFGLAISMAAIVAAFLWLRRSPLRTLPPEARGTVPLPSAGVVPFFFVGGPLYSGASDDLALGVAAIVAVGGGLSFLFFDTAALSRAHGVNPTSIRRARLGGTALTLGWLGALAVVVHLAARTEELAGSEPLLILFVVAVLDDAIAEWRFRRRHGRLVAIHELQRLWLGEAVRTTCAERGIPVLLRGASFRSLFQVLGPLFEVTVLVPEARAEEARSSVRDRLAAALGEALERPAPASAEPA